MMTGDVTPTQGQAFIGGYSIAHYPTAVRRLMGYCPQHDALFDLLTARETLRFYGTIRGIPKDKMEKMITFLIDRLSLTEFANRPCGTYSGGNKVGTTSQRVMLARALSVMYESLLNGCSLVPLFVSSVSFSESCRWPSRWWATRRACSSMSQFSATPRSASAGVCWGGSCRVLTICLFFCPRFLQALHWNGSCVAQIHVVRTHARTFAWQLLLQAAAHLRSLLAFSHRRCPARPVSLSLSGTSSQRRWRIAL